MKKTIKQIRSEARAEQREKDISEMCRVLKWHCQMPEAADALWAAMNDPAPKKQSADDTPALDRLNEVWLSRNKITAPAFNIGVDLSTQGLKP